MDETSRRPLKSRDYGFYKRLASWCARKGVTPNSVSLLSTGCAILSALAMLQLSTAPCGMAYLAYTLLAIAGILLRLSCNLIDGMIAIEGGKKTPAGDIFNNLPDPVSDLILFAGAAYLLPGDLLALSLGWLAACLAILTAYTRMLGALVTGVQDFGGPMAKPHRMAVLMATLACLCGEHFLLGSAHSLPIGLGIVCLGCVVTIARRLKRIGQRLGAKP